MKNVVSKFKYALIALLVLLVVGMTLLGVLGLNQSIMLGKNHEISVAIEVNIDDAGDVVRATSEKYFAEKGIKVNASNVINFNEGEKYSFKTASLNGLNAEEIKTQLEDALNTALTAEQLAGLNPTVTTYETYGFTSVKWSILIACAIALVAIFIYYAIIEKISGALTVIIVSVVSAVLHLALVAITRLPYDPVLGTCIMLSAVFAGILSGGIVNRAKELSKIVTEKKRTNTEIANLATESSNVRFAFVSIVLLVALIAFIAFGGLTVRLIALQVLLAVVSAVAVSYFFTGFLWANIKKQ